MTGRHFIPIDNYIVTTLRQRGISWSAIASHPQVNVHRDTLRLWRIRTNFVEPRITLSDDDLDAVICNHIEGESLRGMVTIEAFLSISGYAVLRAQLRASMHQADQHLLDGKLLLLYPVGTKLFLPLPVASESILQNSYSKTGFFLNFNPLNWK